MKKYIHAARSSSAYTPKGQKRSQQPFVYNGQKFTEDQMEQIRRGLASGVDVDLYADPKFRYSQMNQIRKGLESGLDISQYADPKYSYEQMTQLREGLESGVDISLYADPKFNGGQMWQIKEGLKSGLDISLYADTKFDSSQMNEIRRGLESGLDISWYADPKFDWWQMYQIREGLRSGVDVSQYADPELGGEEMFKTRKRLEKLLERGLPTNYESLSKHDKAKVSWARVKKALDSEEYNSVADIEEEFDLMPLEGSAANKLGISFEEANDGSITFKDQDGVVIASLTSHEYDNIVEDAIKHSSTRSSFTKAFATRLKHILGL